MVRFIDSWLSNRNYITRLGADSSASIEYSRGVPRGSVLSCVLLSTFFSDIIADLECDCFLYADDLKVQQSGKLDSIRITFDAVQRDLVKISDFCARWGLEVNKSKTKCVIFTRSKRVRTRAAVLELSYRGIKLKFSSESKYLGIIFDKCCTFEADFNRRFDKFKKHVISLQRLSGVKWGCPTTLLIRLYKTTALPSLLYAPWILSLVKSALLAKAEAAQRSFLKWVLSIPRVGSGTATEAYCLVPSISRQVTRLCATHAARIQNAYDDRLHDAYVGYLNSDMVITDGRCLHATNLSLFGALVQACDRLHLPHAMPSRKPFTLLPSMLIDRPPVDLPALHKHSDLPAAYNWASNKINSLPANSLKVYVDGSMLEDGLVGAGFHLDLDGVVHNKCFRLTGGARTAYQGELVAILLALRFINSLNLPPLRKAFIISDCQAGIQASLKPARDNFLGTTIFDELQASPGITNLVWIPSHVGILGNHVADELANAGAEQDEFMFEVPTDLTSWKIKIKNAAFDNWAHEWQNNSWDCPALRSLLPDLRNHPGFLLANNRLDKQLARLRMNYVSLNGFLFRHGLAVHNYCEPCRATYNSMLIQSASHHLLNCPTYKHERASMFTTVNAILNRPTDSDVSLTDLLCPVGTNMSNFGVAEAVNSFIVSTISRFL